jgi:hypothetical protein
MQDDFIKVYPGAFSRDFCAKAIQHFEIADQQGFVQSRRQRNEKIFPLSVDDASYFLNEANEVVDNMGEADVNSFASTQIAKEIQEILLSTLYGEYAEEFATVQMIKELNSYVIKAQRTKPGGGYHLWHAEVDGRHTCNRVLVWQIFLNDIEEGGETEFLYQHKRVKPVAGTAMIWPAGFTHTHRGNPPLKDTKYILTGWIEL